MTTRCGFIAVVGAPNAGKSTLVNRMVGARIAIVTPKVQTTRNRILGITIHERSQLIFIDTPGIFNATAKFEQAMVQSALGSTADADVVMVMIDAYKGICDNTAQVLNAVAPLTTRKVAVLNKVDKVDKSSLLALAQAVSQADSAIEEIFMISAQRGDGVADMRDWLAGAVPEDAWHYPEDQMTDIPMRQMAAETTRESLFYRLQQELPYSVSVETEKWQQHKDGSIEVRQVIHVQNENQKKIVIGKGGASLKEIGQASRTRLQKFMQRRVHLFLHVKVSERWKENKEFYTSIGLDYS